MLDNCAMRTIVLVDIGYDGKFTGLLEYNLCMLFISIQATFKGWMDIMFSAVDSQKEVIRCSRLARPVSHINCASKDLNTFSYNP